MLDVRRSRVLLLLTTSVALSAICLFILYLSESYTFTRTRLRQAIFQKPEGTRDFTVQLHPEDHQHRAAAPIRLDWTVSKGLRYPDGVGKWVYLVNGQFPCPNIEARSGDTIILDLHNGLEDEGLAIHFHGIRMEGQNHMDGVVGVTQRAIQPGRNFTYEFKIGFDQAGTFWWHAHSELIRADGLFGALIVHAPASEDPAVTSTATPRDYDDDLVLMVGDWYHRSSQKVQEDYDSYTHWGMEPSPDSLLINGQGRFNCERAAHGRPLHCVSLPKPSFRPQGARSRLRVINVGAMSGVSIRLPGRAMKVLAVDGGNPVKPQSEAWSTVGVLHAGERVDLLVDWSVLDHHDADNTSLSIILDREYYRMKNLALEPEQSFPLIRSQPTTHRRMSKSTTPMVSNATFDLSTVRSPPYSDGVLGGQSPDKNIVLYTRIELLAHLENRPKGYINHTYWIPQEQPLIDSPKSAWDKHQLVAFVGMSKRKDLWVDIVINNVDELGHPFHLHGYDFYIISRFQPATHLGWHAYNPFDQSKEPLGGPYNLVDPPRKDTVHVPAAGYVVLRINANNPGLWLLHCHVLWHHAVGMAMTLEVGDQAPS